MDSRGSEHRNSSGNDRWPLQEARENKAPINQSDMLLKPSGKNGNVVNIIVEGNIGSGKTTFLNIFGKASNALGLGSLVLPEPIEQWRNVGGQNLFQLLADDPKRWSFTFQSYVYRTMANIHQMIPKGGAGIKIMERSLYSARYCFVENLYAKGLLQPAEVFVLDECFKAASLEASVDLFVYLKTDPDVVFERIQRRARPEESGLTLDYLRSLHTLHEAWLTEHKFGRLPAPVVVIDANVPLEQIVPIYREKTRGILKEHAPHPSPRRTSKLHRLPSS